jgi:transcriptional regulator with XRE-family HTH domain
MKARFGQNLARCREGADVSQEELSFRASNHRTEVSLLERGERMPRVDTALRLVGSLGVPLNDLVAGLEWRPGYEIVVPGSWEVVKRGGGVAKGDEDASSDRLPMTAGSRSKTPFPFKALARFADNLYRARELAGLDQKEAAKRAALTRSRLDKIENGEYVPTLDVLIRIAGTYSTSVGDLVSGVTWRPGWVEQSGPAEYVVSENDFRRRFDGG